MSSRSLQDWLRWQETLNPKEIDLGLDRVEKVLLALGWPRRFECPLITVAGTNGKGSVVAFAEAVARASGLSTASYTSPHLLHYNERIRLNGQCVDDAALCAAFERVDAARGEVPLTYFEFGTLAAIDLFQRAAPQLVVLEVGLGGRLDAVNVMDADVAVITTIAIDHVDWLGDDREKIGYEKSGIFRPQIDVVCAEPSPPQSLLQRAGEQGCRLYRIGREFRADTADGAWSCSLHDREYLNLPWPALQGVHQPVNAAAALQALRCAGIDPGIDAIRSALTRVRLDGRYQRLQARPDVIADVAHNPQSAAALREQLSADPCSGRTFAVIAMLADKAVAEVVSLLTEAIDGWYCAGLESVPRGLDAQGMQRMVGSVLERGHADGKLHSFKTVSQACAEALAAAGPDDRLLVFGSFYTVAEAMAFFTRVPARTRQE